jgi:hypothetical protein
MVQAIDSELAAEAGQVLKNLFYQDFSALVNAYIKAAEGLPITDFDYQLGDMTSVFGRDDNAAGEPLRISTTCRDGNGPHTHPNLLAALQEPGATKVWMLGKMVFERKSPSNEWFDTLNTTEF